MGPGPEPFGSAQAGRGFSLPGPTLEERALELAVPGGQSRTPHEENASQRGRDTSGS
jgi:hypothetical protein